MPFYDDYTYWGMHLFWWLIWLIVLVWIFATPWAIPGERRPPDDPLQILKQRLAKGEISIEEYRHLQELLKAEN